MAAARGGGADRGARAAAVGQPRRRRTAPVATGHAGQPRRGARGQQQPRRRRALGPPTAARGRPVVGTEQQQ